MAILKMPVLRMSKTLIMVLILLFVVEEYHYVVALNWLFIIKKKTNFVLRDENYIF